MLRTGLGVFQQKNITSRAPVAMPRLLHAFKLLHALHASRDGLPNRQQVQNGRHARQGLVDDPLCQSKAGPCRALKQGRLAVSRLGEPVEQSWVLQGTAGHCAALQQGRLPSSVCINAELLSASAARVHLRDEEVILHELLQLAPHLPVVMLQQVLQGLHVELDAIAAQMLLRPAAGEVKVPLQGSNPAGQQFCSTAQASVSRCTPSRRCCWLVMLECCHWAVILLHAQANH